MTLSESMRTTVAPRAVHEPPATRGVTIVRIGSSSYLRISGNDTWNAGTVTVAVGLSALPKLLETRTQ